MDRRPYRHRSRSVRWEQNQSWRRPRVGYCEFRIQEIQLSDPYSPLRNQQVHFQVTELPVDEPDLTVGPELFFSNRALLVPSGHPLARRTSVSLEDLADTTLLTIGGVAPQHWLDYHFPRFTPTGRRIPHGHAAISWQEIPFLVAAGAGVSLASVGAATHAGSPGVTWIPVEEEHPIRFAAIWPKAGTSARMRAFVALLYETAQTDDVCTQLNGPQVIDW
ncbi:LysR family transcriptional regulator substrate-binding protein [Nocardia sp. NPDC058114]|uniref:LysR family transcriptional regulator substrate-binding protein n=1 Tax=Nocardia sp. NPDC058114 TaxID=3346346 RepID=UPI0036D76781